jgi:hypothetical protein
MKRTFTTENPIVLEMFSTPGQGPGIRPQTKILLEPIDQSSSFYNQPLAMLLRKVKP